MLVYIPGFNTKCNIIMGEGCGNSSGNYTDKTVNYTRWQNAMNKIGAKCPGNSIFNPKCTTGCYGHTQPGLEDIPFIRLLDSAYCLDP
jgi:hypothetical protein